MKELESARAEFTGKTVVGLYLFLRRHEEELDTNTLGALHELERELFEHLSIEEMERLEDDYLNSESGA
ncbi:MAG: hypothetical protein ACQETQ_00345 [Spirochaetota bacterium]